VPCLHDTMSSCRWHQLTYINTHLSLCSCRDTGVGLLMSFDFNAIKRDTQMPSTQTSPACTFKLRTWSRLSHPNLLDFMFALIASGAPTPTLLWP